MQSTTFGPIYRYIQPRKKIILWKERLTWAFIWRTHTLWSELPTEIYRMIDVYMQKTLLQCFTCKLYLCDERISSFYCSAYCKERQRGDTFFGHSSLGMN